MIAAVNDIAVMAQRELRATARMPELLVFAFIQPVMFIVLFRYVFGGAIETGGDYVDFLVPGILVQTAVFGSIFTGIGLTEDMRRGVIDRFRSLPMTRSSLLVGRTISDFVRNLGTVIVMVAVGFLVGWSPSESIFSVLAALLLLLAFAYAFSWIAAAIGLSVSSPETAQSAGFLWMFPLTFASSAFVPVESMPGVVQAFAEVNPVTLVVDAVRALTLGGDATGDVLGALAWFVGILAVFVPLSIARYRKLS